MYGGRTGAVLVVAVIASALLSLGCTIVTLPQSSSPEGTFRGMTLDNRPVQVTISEAPPGFIGHGMLDGVPFSISFLSSSGGSGQLALEDRLRPLAAELASDGQTLVLTLLEEDLLLVKDGAVALVSKGTFSGRFRNGTTKSFVGEVFLSQHGILVSGTGNVLGQRFVLNGFVDEQRHTFRGRAVFTDGSTASVQATLNKKELMIFGIGGPVMFRR